MHERQRLVYRRQFGNLHSRFVSFRHGQPSHATTTRTESAYILAGTLRARRGERDLAIRWWDAAIDASNDKEQAFVAVSNEQRKAGLYDAALVSLRKAIVRSQREEQHPYSDEVVALLTLTGAYDEACDEILAVFALDRDVYRTMRSLTLLQILNL